MTQVDETTRTTPQRIHAFGDDALGTMDATDVAAAIAKGDISAMEAVEAALARSEKVDGALNALEFLDAKRARQRAGRIDSGLSGGLHDHEGAGLRGVPTAFKDNIIVAGVPMTQGSQAMPRVSNRRSGKIATQMLATGLVPIGTTTMPPSAGRRRRSVRATTSPATRGTRAAPRAVRPVAPRPSSRRVPCRSRTATTVVAPSAFLPRPVASSVSSRRDDASCSAKARRPCRSRSSPTRFSPAQCATR